MMPPSGSTTRRLRALSSHLLTSVPAAEKTGSGVVGAHEAVKHDLDQQQREWAEEEAFKQYCIEGKARALSLNNRGPLRFDAEGRLAKDILEKYWAVGFYIFENAISPEELRELQQEFETVMENAPVEKGSAVDKYGRPVGRPAGGQYLFGKPLSDPQGGGKFGIWDWRNDRPGNPRYQMKMREPEPPPTAPERFAMPPVHPMAYMDSALRIYGHPDMLRIAETLNGKDFVPFTEFINYKPPFIGQASAWHQDPSSGWDEDWAKPGFDIGTCGYNCHLSLYNCTPENTLWIVPGSQFARQDIKALSAKAGGTDRLEGAVPVLGGPGDVFMQNRFTLHCAFPNQSGEKRVTLTFGFHRRASALGKRIRQTARQNDPPVVYDEEFLHERSKQIQLAIDARRQHYPKEEPYLYLPFQGKEHECRWNETLKFDKDFFKQFWDRDIGI